MSGVCLGWDGQTTLAMHASRKMCVDEPAVPINATTHVYVACRQLKCLIDGAVYIYGACLSMVLSSMVRTFS